MRSAEIRKVNVLEMKCLRSLAGVSQMDRVWNEEVPGAFNRNGVSEYESEIIEMLWACGKNG